MTAINLSLVRQKRSLDDWENECAKNFTRLYPSIDFFAASWPLRKKYKTVSENFNAEESFRSLSSLDESYWRVSRCFASEIAVKNELVTYRSAQVLKLLSTCGPKSIFDLGFNDLIETEDFLVAQAKSIPSSASTILANLNRLVIVVERLRDLGIIETASWSLSPDKKRILTKICHERRLDFRTEKAKILDRQIEALADATSAMLARDVRLTNYDRVAIAVLNIMMCAPARINEPLCMSINDFCSVEDYKEKSSEHLSVLDINRVHMLLLQKGSKGASWGAKPVLNFMIELLNKCVHVILEEGQRSRKLVEWYENNPEKLYLPNHLEHLRGKNLDREDLWKIMYLLDEVPPVYGRANISGITKSIFADLRKRGGEIIQIKNPRSISKNGQKSPRQFVQAVSWDAAERVMLKRVHERMESIRNVSPRIAYTGKISEMLMLVDGVETPYLPAAVKYGALASRFKQTETSRKNRSRAPTVFESLGLLMVAEGVVQNAYIETHDPRRWLTTQAMLSKERLSDVLINKWANRVSLKQVESYDLRTDYQKADQAAMPTTELSDVSAGLTDMEKIGAELGARPEFLLVNDANIALTSMDAIVSAQEDRPVARTANQLIILYPTPYGVCTHQHHETPCSAYHQCAPCNSAIAVKGHLPTNEALRNRYEVVFRSIVSQIDRLVAAHNREIADSKDALEAHMIKLVSAGLGVQLAEELIDNFHEIKGRLKSNSLKNKLEEAFAERGLLRYIDSKDVASGALIKFHNPGRNGCPSLERFMDSVGGRAMIAEKISVFSNENPEFGITELGITSSKIVDTGGMVDDGDD